MAASDGINVLALYSINNVLIPVANGVNVTLPFSQDSASIKKVGISGYTIAFEYQVTIKTQFYGRLDLTLEVPTLGEFSINGGLCGTPYPEWMVGNGSSYAGPSYDNNQKFIHQFGETCKYSFNVFKNAEY